MVPFLVLFVQRFLLQYLIKVKEIDINEVEKLAASVNVFFFIDSSWQQIQPLTRISFLIDCCIQKVSSYSVYWYTHWYSICIISYIQFCLEM